MSESFFTRDKRASGWYWKDNEVVDHYLPIIGAYGYAVYGILVRNSYSGAVSLSHQKIAAQMKCSVATVKRSLEQLMELGLVSVQSRKEAGAGNVYFVMNTPEPGSSPTAPPVRAPRKQSINGLTFLPNGKVISSGEVATTAPPTKVPNLQSDPLPIYGSTGSVNDSAAVLGSKTNKTDKTSAGLFADPQGEDLQKPVKPKRQPPNTLWGQLIEAIDQAYLQANGVRPGWPKLALARLKKETTERSGWGIEAWQRCISNRFASGGRVNLGEAPETFIPRLKDFIGGPLNQFGSTGGQHGSGKRSNYDIQREELARATAVPEAHGWGEGDPVRDGSESWGNDPGSGAHFVVEGDLRGFPRR